MKKKILFYLAVFLLIVTSPFNISLKQGQNSFISIEKSESYAADNTIRITKSSDATATKIHEQLKKGKSITLTIKGDTTAATKILTSLNNRIKKINKQGVIFYYTFVSYDGTYSTYLVTQDQATTYQYAVKFINKLYSNTRSAYVNNTQYKNYVKDTQTYTTKKSLKAHLIYDDLVKAVQRFYAGYVFLNKPKATTKSSMYINDYKEFYMHYDYNLVVDTILYHDGYYDDEGNLLFYYDEDAGVYRYPGKKKTTKSPGKYSKLGYAYTVSFKSFEDFYKQAGAKDLLPYFDTFSYTKQITTIVNTRYFYGLSDAMKVYAIGLSDYFGCHFSGFTGYGMIYDYKHKYTTEPEGMKNLYYNRANGVCATFADYECYLWKSLGFEHYYRTNYNINHAWSVVKVANSKGKYLWIPFDYGIGPAAGLAVSDEVREKYIKTEAMRYKLYLAGIEGAPSKKNFKDSDFN